jgi:hypothetical protein
MARGQRDRAKEQYWRRHLAACRRSGQSVRTYCRVEGLSEPSFYAWRRVLTERGREHATSPRLRENTAAVVGSRAAGAAEATAPAALSPFVPVRLVEDAAPATVEVVLRGGRVVRVAAGFAAQTLRAVVAALEDLPC